MSRSLVHCRHLPSVLLELGYNSLDSVRAMLKNGWSEITVIDDLAGLPRVIAARLLPQVSP
jgi:hypothetical protein